MKFKQIETLVEIVKVYEKRSTCVKAHVACVLAKEGRIVSVGYNGAPSGLPHCSEIGCGDSDSCTNSIHAEQNAIAYAAKEGISTNGTSAICSYSPCLNCAKLLINAGITEFIYLNKYRNEEGIDLLEKCGIKCYDYEEMVLDNLRKETLSKMSKIQEEGGIGNDILKEKFEFGFKRTSNAVEEYFNDNPPHMHIARIPDNGIGHYAPGINYDKEGNFFDDDGYLLNRDLIFEEKIRKLGYNINYRSKSYEIYDTLASPLIVVYQDSIYHITTLIPAWNELNNKDKIPLWNTVVEYSSTIRKER